MSARFRSATAPAIKDMGWARTAHIRGVKSGMGLRRQGGKKADEDKHSDRDNEKKDSG